jgi:hypothetical protein
MISTDIGSKKYSLPAVRKVICFTMTGLVGNESYTLSEMMVTSDAVSIKPLTVTP